MTTASLNAIGFQSLQAGKFAAIRSQASMTPAQISPNQARMEAQFKEVGEKFESMFLSEMLSHLNEGMEPDNNFGGGQAEQMFKGLLTEQYAQEISKRGGIGIAPAIENYLKAQYLTSTQPPAIQESAP